MRCDPPDQFSWNRAWLHLCKWSDNLCLLVLTSNCGCCSVYELRYFNIAENEGEEED